MKTAELGNVLLLAVAVFIVVWGLVYGLWGPYWGLPVAVAAAVVFKRTRS